MFLPAHAAFCDITTALVLNTTHKHFHMLPHHTMPAHNAWNKSGQIGDYGTLWTAFFFFFLFTVNGKFSDFIEAW